MLKLRLQKEYCSTKRNLLSALIKDWYHGDDLAEIRSILVEPTQNRVLGVIALGCLLTEWAYGPAAFVWGVFAGTF